MNDEAKSCYASFLSEGNHPPSKEVKAALREALPLFREQRAALHRAASKALLDNATASTTLNRPDRNYLWSATHDAFKRYAREVVLLCDVDAFIDAVAAVVAPREVSDADEPDCCRCGWPFAAHPHTRCPEGYTPAAAKPVKKHVHLVDPDQASKSGFRALCGHNAQPNEWCGVTQTALFRLGTIWEGCSSRTGVVNVKSEDEVCPACAVAATCTACGRPWSDHVGGRRECFTLKPVVDARPLLAYVQGFLRAIPHRAGSDSYAPYLLPDTALIHQLQLLHAAVFTPDGDPREVPEVNAEGLFVINGSPAPSRATVPPTVTEFAQALTQFQHAVERQERRRNDTYSSAAERTGAMNASDAEVTATGDHVLDLFRKAKEP